ncbi:hypothetical protein FKL64_24100 [Escherichia coli]|nr:hypothetical protein [Escherichia coli]
MLAGWKPGRFEEGVACPHCHDSRTDEQRANYAERHRQALLAEKRGQAHVGAVLRDKGRDTSGTK